VFKKIFFGILTRFNEILHEPILKILYKEYVIYILLINIYKGW